MRRLTILLAATTLLACGEGSFTSREDPPDSGGIDVAPDAGVSEVGGADAGAPDLGLADAGSSSSLEALLDLRFQGDRTGACVVAARIAASGELDTALHVGDARACGLEHRFEIGSISKTMTGLLVHRLIERGRVQLDDQVEAHLPPEALPIQAGPAPILLRHLLAHTSGLPRLPPGFAPANLQDPYRDFSAEDLWRSLPRTPVEAEPGVRWAYSNLGYMVLSGIVSRASGMPFPELARQELFEPLGMVASVAEAPDLAPLAEPHLPSGELVPAWNFAPELAGVGGVRATLGATVRYAQLLVGRGPPELVATMSRAAQPIAPGLQPGMASGFILVDVGARTLHFHGGATGGSGAVLVADRSTGEAVVVLSSTSWINIGGLDELALHLLDPTLVPLAAPRREASPPLGLVRSLAGRYLIGSVPLELVEAQGQLLAPNGGGEPLRFGYDSYGDFYPIGLDALLRPISLAGGAVTFDWIQGAVFRAERQ